MGDHDLLDEGDTSACARRSCSKKPRDAGYRVGRSSGLPRSDCHCSARRRAGRSHRPGDSTPTTPTTTTAVSASPIVKPLPPEWFTIIGTNAEMRWDSVAGQPYETANERFFVRNHTSTPLIDARTWQLRVFGSGLRGAPDVDHARTFSYRDLEGDAVQGGHRIRRVRGQRP